MTSFRTNIYALHHAGTRRSDPEVVDQATLVAHVKFAIGQHGNAPTGSLERLPPSKITGLGQKALAAELERYREVVAVAREKRLSPNALIHRYGR